jgi:mono/diheme cytochrome c family protein
MKYLMKLTGIAIVLFLLSCGGGEEKKDKKQVKIGTTKKEVKKTANASDSKIPMIDLNNKGVGPIKSVALPETIDEEMVAVGAGLFKSKCTACHRANKKFIGPAPVGILERRSAEWIMNMILDPEGMTKNDPIAKQLLIDYNGSPMANQSLTEEEARAILEYFRTLK